MRIISIAVVDDNPVQNKLTIEKLDQISRLNKFEKVNLMTKEYLSGMDLLHAKQTYDLIIMDYDMPVMNGIEVAEELTKRGSNTKLIFLSGYDDILRPLQKSTSSKLIRGFVFKTDPTEEFQHHVINVLEEILDVHFITIRHYEELENIDTGKYEKNFYEDVFDAKKIMTIEAQDKMAFVYMKDETELLTLKSLKMWLSELPSGDFYFANKKCLINFKYVSLASDKEIQLVDGELLKIGVTYKARLKEMYRIYRMREAKK